MEVHQMMLQLVHRSHANTTDKKTKANMQATHTVKGRITFQGRCCPLWSISQKAQHVMQQAQRQATAGSIEVSKIVGAA